MNDIQNLKDKIRELEKRIAELEKRTGSEDPLYKDARRLVIKHQKVSLMFLQKYLFIDIDRAGKILDRLEKDGVVGPPAGIKPRKILVTE